MKPPDADLGVIARLARDLSSNCLPVLLYNYTQIAGKQPDKKLADKARNTLL